MTFQIFTCLYSCLITFICIFIHLFEHFNVIALFKLNIIIIIIYYYYYICAQFVNNCLQYYNELCVCGNLMRNTHNIGLGNTYMDKMCALK